VDPQIFERSGSPVAFTQLTSAGVAVLPRNNETLSFVSTSDADININVFVRGESGGVEVSETVVLSGTIPKSTVYGYDMPITVAKPVTTGDITVSGFASATFLLQLLAEEKERKHIRLWIQPTPRDEDGVKALICGKRKCKPLVNDNDTPILRGLAHYLISKTCCWLFTKSGDTAMAAKMDAEASTSMSNMISKEISQNAYSTRIIPKVEPMAHFCGVGHGNWI
jgi:hypothetical protein